MTAKSPLISESAFARHHHQHLFHVAGEGYFLTWFDQELENLLDLTWPVSPSAAFALHQRMTRWIMNTLITRIPQVRVHGCAPLPPWTPLLKKVLTPYDFLYFQDGRFNRAYAVLTFWPWKSRGKGTSGEGGGCAECALRKTDQGRDRRDCEGRFFDVRNLP